MAKEKYDHITIEKAAQEKWESLQLHAVDLTDTEKEPYYLLTEFPYPSGDLHIGHWYAFSIPDIYARLLRAQGKNVLFPFGFDSFGLPAENAAIKNGVDPKEWTYANMDRMRTQVKSMGTSLDWSKEVVTSDPEYYKWTQWLFTKLFEQGLAYRKIGLVNWDPVDKTVLANEQILPDGTAERSGALVEKKELEQWFLRITQYADRLLNDLEPLPWREEIKEAQRAWIGRSEGARLTFQVIDPKNGTTPFPTEEGSTAIEVFTTRPDTIYGATYVVLAPENSLVEVLMPKLGNADAVQVYRAATARKSERDRSENKQKTGVKLEGLCAINPATKKEIPIFIADYVLNNYGTGAVMAVPAHDERDYEFAKVMNQPMVQVIAHETVSDLYAGSGTLINSGEFDGRDSFEVIPEIVQSVGGEMQTNYRLRDWLISRQRYWGCPIPVVYDPEGNPHMVPADHLPWMLPTDVDFTNLKRDDGKSPLATSTELKDRVTRLFGEGWTPEYDTLDVFADSSWYFVRYLAAHNPNFFSDTTLMEKWLPINRYSGGAEHTTVHVLYSRFFYKALFDMALVPTSEPFIERFNRGIIMGTDGQKMSKRWGNVVNPDEMVAKYGADAVRLYLGFIGPYNEPGSYPWNLDGVEAMRRFLDRVALLREKIGDEAISPKLQKAIARASVKVAGDADRFKFNTAISAIMVLLKDMEALPSVARAAYRELLVILAPFAPHLAEYLYEESASGEEGAASRAGSVHQLPWLTVDEALLKDETATVIVQIAGKKRAELSISAETTQDEAVSLALALPEVAKFLPDGKTSRVIYVPGRILNLVP